MTEQQPEYPVQPVLVDDGRLVEHVVPGTVFDSHGCADDRPVLINWDVTNPLVLNFREVRGPQSISWWEAPLHVLVEAIEDKEGRRLEEGASVHVWRNGDHLSTMLVDGETKRLFQVPVQQVWDMINAAFWCMGQLGGVEIIEGTYKQGGLAALEMLANGGLNDS